MRTPFTTTPLPVQFLRSAAVAIALVLMIAAVSGVVLGHAAG